MAREFSNGDAANLLKHYKRLLTEAKNIAQGVSAMEASVAKEADAVLSSQELFDSILDQLKTGLYDLSLRPSEKALIASVQNNIEYLNQYEQLKTLKQKNDPTDASYISQ